LQSDCGGYFVSSPTIYSPELLQEKKVTGD